MRRARRGWMALGVLAVLACYTVHMDETQVRTIASEDMDCDPSLVHLEVGDSNQKTVARYMAHGCERTRTYDCQTDPEGHVTCRSPYTSAPSSDKSSDGHEVAETVAAGAVGCACASLFAHKSSDPPATTSEPANVNSTTPQRNR